MPDFQYEVIDSRGKTKKGTISAREQGDAMARLRADGYVVVNITKASVLNKEISFSFGTSVKPRELSVFCRQFVSMINAGVTVLDTLEMLSEQTENKAMAAAIRSVHADIQKGETLSGALSKFPKVFPSIMVSMVAAGEASGKLEIAFDRMASHFEKSAHLKAIIKKAMMYPIMVLCVALVVVVVMLVKVIPSYQDMFSQLGQELPALTKVVIALSDFLLVYWWLVIIVLVVAVVGISVFKRTETGQRLFGMLAIKLPAFGPLITKQSASNFARTMSTLIYSGLPMMEALSITAGTMTNYHFRQALIHAKEDVAKGVPLTEPIQRSGLFPPMVGHMTKIGEETGDLEGMLTKMADYYDEEVEMATQTFISALEPMIILLLAGVVGVIIGAIMAPMFKMYGAMESL